ncbi:MAG: hypothetical protein U0K87_11975 [Ruminococcus sp.]|nr:hypothetical protein [Ruminococcus sp.]MEE1173061.1 hypothetical protein [Ruminococcus sp.]
MVTETGRITIDGVEFYPGYTFEDFKKTKFYSNQDGIRIIRLNGVIKIDNHQYLVNLFFREYTLYMISLVCVDVDIPFEEEEKRAMLHRQIMAEYGLSDVNVFSWGTLKVIYDPRSNSSKIGVIFQ